MTYEEVKAMFEKDVAGHVMEVVTDTEQVKCMIFKNPETGFYWFNVCEFPKGTVITGSRGTYSFSRSLALFEQSDSLNYFEEKCTSVDKNDSIKKFCHDTAMKNAKFDILTSFRYREDGPYLKKEVRRETWDEVINILNSADNYHEWLEAVQEVDDEYNLLTDYWDNPESNYMVFTTWFMWNVCALKYAAQKYAEYKNAQTEEKKSRIRTHYTCNENAEFYDHETPEEARIHHDSPEMLPAVYAVETKKTTLADAFDDEDAVIDFINDLMIKLTENELAQQDCDLRTFTKDEYHEIWRRISGILSEYEIGVIHFVRQYVAKRQGEL